MTIFDRLEREWLEQVKEEEMLVQQQMYDEEVENGKLGRIQTNEHS